MPRRLDHLLRGQYENQHQFEVGDRSSLDDQRHLFANAIAGTNIGIALPEFVDSPEEQGLVLSAFFYGYLLTQVLQSSPKYTW